MCEPETREQKLKLLRRYMGLAEFTKLVYVLIILVLVVLLVGFVVQFKSEHHNIDLTFNMLLMTSSMNKVMTAHDTGKWVNFLEMEDMTGVGQSDLVINIYLRSIKNIQFTMMKIVVTTIMLGLFIGSMMFYDWGMFRQEYERMRNKEEGFK